VWEIKIILILQCIVFFAFPLSEKLSSIV